MIAAVLFLLGATMTDLDLADFDKLWDFDHPDSTEAKFRELLPAARASGNPDVLAQLLTQIARTQGLQKKFDESNATLDEVDKMLGAVEDSSAVRIARVRHLLERGRVLNTSKQGDRGRSQFLAAWDAARASGADGFAVDAAHMMGIIEPPDEALRWNERAIAHAEQSKNERARNWLGSLYNNTGWTYHDKGEYAKALVIFEKALAWREEKKQAPEIRIAKWSVARALRSLGRAEEALARQRALLAEFDSIGEADGFVHEELGECLLVLGREAEARPHFARAHELLSKDPWLPGNEPERIARLKRLGEGAADSTGASGQPAR